MKNISLLTENNHLTIKPMQKLTDHEKKARGTYRPSRHQADPASTLTELPPAPAHFDNAQRKVWHDVTIAMQANGTLHADLLPLVGQYATFSSLSEYWAVAADDLIMKATTHGGTLTEYARLNQLARLNSQSAAKLAAMLGLSPATRKPAPIPAEPSILDQFLNS